MTTIHPPWLRYSLRCVLTYQSTLRALLARALPGGRLVANGTLFGAPPNVLLVFEVELFVLGGDGVGQRFDAL